MMTIYYSEFGKDIRTITDYLNERGYYPDDARIVDFFWKKFSDDMYFAGWIRVTENTLAEFVEYIDKEFKNTYLLRSLEG